MNYEILYTLTLVIFALIITWCFFKIRKLKDEIMDWREKAVFSPTEANEMRRHNFFMIAKIIELDEELGKLKS